MMHAIQCEMMWCDRCSAVSWRSVSLLCSGMLSLSGLVSLIVALTFLPAAEVESALECFDASGNWTDHAVYWSAHSALEC